VPTYKEDHLRREGRRQSDPLRGFDGLAAANPRSMQSGWYGKVPGRLPAWDRPHRARQLLEL